MASADEKMVKGMGDESLSANTSAATHDSSFAFLPDSTSPLSESPASMMPRLDEKEEEEAELQSQPAGYPIALDLEKQASLPNSSPVYSLFTRREKQFIVFMIAWAGFFSPLSGNIYFPALNTLASQFSVSDSLINLTITSYMIFQGLSPTIFGDIADMLGRRPTYVLAFVIYFAANIGLATQDSYVALLVLRCMQSAGSSGTVALAYGVVGDIATSAERGTYIGWASAGALTGPALGPIIGGVLSETLGWRAIFWFLVIFSGIYLVTFVLFCPETGRNVVGNGSIPPPSWNMSLLNWMKTRKEALASVGVDEQETRQVKLRAQADLTSKRTLRVPNPLGTLLIMVEKDVAVILLFNTLVFTAFYQITASTPSFFYELYGYNDLQIGICYIPLGVGSSMAALIFGKLVDYNYRRVAKAANFPIDRKRGDDLKNFPLERARIQVIWLPFSIGTLAVLCYGWVIHQRAPLAAPLVLQFIIGFCFAGCFNVLSTLLVDLYPAKAAMATAANNLGRCLVGAGGVALINPMIGAMGVGPCFSFVAAVLGLVSPLLWVECRWGPGWREGRRVREERLRIEVQGKM